MTSCEYCWEMSYDGISDHTEKYMERVNGHNCTPEMQAGRDAKICSFCGRKTIHQYT